MLLSIVSELQFFWKFLEIFCFEQILNLCLIKNDKWFAFTKNIKKAENNEQTQLNHAQLNHKMSFWYPHICNAKQQFSLESRKQIQPTMERASANNHLSSHRGEEWHREANKPQEIMTQNKCAKLFLHCLNSRNLSARIVCSCRSDFVSWSAQLIRFSSAVEKELFRFGNWKVNTN